ncbi:hypothetical protein GE061_016459 [Apolygus lucorum]|uniref:Uncharacterized protein n=1 Tax=Apolygus lucorum TaxID=248454 RepID=A0A6A4KJF7_APOLU|nr:hypothetical protein GE061_016459 [Apolygus lucorum]
MYVILVHDIERYYREGYRNSDYTHHYIVSFLHIGCNTKIFGIAMTFSVFTDLLGDYFLTLNSLVMSDTSNASKRSLHVISETYDCLFDVVHQINSVFASTLLVLVLNCFVKCTDNFYKIIKGDDSLYWCIYFALWMAVVVMQLLMLVQSVNYPLKQANLYEWLMYKRMKNEPTSSAGPSQTKLTLHLMRRKKAKFDLCGFTTLDNGLLGKISAATLTYSIVLSQLSTYPPVSINMEAEVSAMTKNCSL